MMGRRRHNEWPEWGRELLHTLTEQMEEIMSNQSELDVDVAALTQAVADATARVTAEINDLEAKVSAGTQVSAADIQGIKDATSALAQLGVQSAPAPAPAPTTPV